MPISLTEAPHSLHHSQAYNSAVDTQLNTPPVVDRAATSEKPVLRPEARIHIQLLLADLIQALTEVPNVPIRGQEFLFERITATIAVMRKELTQTVAQLASMPVVYVQAENALTHLAVSLASLHKLEKLLHEMLGDTASEAGTTQLNRDYKTQVFVPQGVVRELNRISAELLNNTYSDPSCLERIKFLTVDMMLFHYGNAELTTSGFDARIAFVMQAFLSLEQHLLSQTEITTDATPELYRYTTESAQATQLRTAIAVAKERGIIIIPCRVNAGGGDEFIFTIKTRSNDLESEKIAREIIALLLKQTTFLPDAPVLTSEMHNLPTGTAEAELLAHQLDFLRLSDSALETTDLPTKRFIDGVNAALANFFRAQQLTPLPVPTMNYAQLLIAGKNAENERLTSLADAFNLFFSDHGGATELSGPISREEARIDMHNLLALVWQLIDAEQIGNAETGTIKTYTIKEGPEKGTTKQVFISDFSTIRNICHRALLQYVIDRYLEILNSVVNQNAKKTSKIELIYQSLTGDPAAISVILAAAKSQRHLLGISDTLSDLERIDILWRTLNFYETKYTAAPPAESDVATYELWNSIQALEAEYVQESTQWSTAKRARRIAMQHSIKTGLDPN